MRDDKRISVSVPAKDKHIISFIDFYAKRHKVKRSKAIRQIVNDLIDLTEENKEKEKEMQKLQDLVTYLKQHIPQELSSVEEAPKPATSELSEKPCHFVVYVKREPKCADQDAPIDSYLKKHLNGQICALCHELKKKKLEETQKKQDEEQEKQLEKLRRENHKLQERLNKRLKQEDEFRGQPRVNYHP